MIIGSVLCVMIAAGLYFLIVAKANERIKGVQAELDTATQIAARLPSAERKLEQVRLEYSRQFTAYNRFMRAKMPAIALADRPQGMIALWNEQAFTLGPMLERWPAKTGVRRMNSVSVPAAPTDPNAINTTFIPISIGTFQVQGDYGTIMRHVRRWNDFGRLVQLSPISISGQSPNMTAQYSVTVLLVPMGEAGPAFSMSGASVASAAGGGSTVGQ